MVIMTLIFFISSLHLCIFFLFLRHSFFFSRLLRQLTSDPCRLTIRVCFFPWLTLLCRFLFLFFVTPPTLQHALMKSEKLITAIVLRLRNVTYRTVFVCVCDYTLSAFSLFGFVYTVFFLFLRTTNTSTLCPRLFGYCVYFHTLLA